MMQSITYKPFKLKEAIGAHSDLSDMLLTAFLQRQEAVLNDIVEGINY